MFNEAREKRLDLIRALASRKVEVWKCQKCGASFIPKEGGDAVALCPTCEAQQSKKKPRRWWVTDKTGTVEVKR